MKKLSLNKETIATLDNKAMSEVKGGFLYSLSTGRKCTQSKMLGAKNGYECGKKVMESICEN